jgi:hypothetical protein
VHQNLKGPCWLSCSCLLLVRLVVSEIQWELAVHSVLWVSQRELTWCLTFPSHFLYNLKFQQAHFSASLISAGFSLGLFFNLEDGGDMFPLKRRQTFNRPHSAIFQQREPFITTATRTSDPAFCTFVVNTVLVLNDGCWWIGNWCDCFFCLGYLTMLCQLYRLCNTEWQGNYMW